MDLGSYTGSRFISNIHDVQLSGLRTVLSLDSRRDTVHHTVRPKDLNREVVLLIREFFGLVIES